MKEKNMRIKGIVWKINDTAVITIPKTHTESGNIQIGDIITIEVINNEEKENTSNDKQRS